jgi:hypothetical protein
MLMALTADAAYGLRWQGLAGPELSLAGACDWPVVSVAFRHQRDLDGESDRVDGDRAVIRTPAALLRLHRAAARLEVCAPAPVPVSDVVHPALWPAAAVLARWEGRETLHAGAFTLDGRGAWAILGERGAGKSSLLAALALEGVELLADDLLVIDTRDCLAGPRCLDLRPAAAAALGIAPRTELVRCTRRRRLALPPARARYQLRGFVYLAWGSELRIEEMAPAERFRALVEHRRLANLGADFDHLLDLASLPAVRLARPHRWKELPEVLREITAAAGGAGPPLRRGSAARDANAAGEPCAPLPPPRDW